LGKEALERGRVEGLMNEEMLKASGYFDEVGVIDEQLMNKMLYGIWVKNAIEEETNNVGRHQADSDNNTDNFVIF
jgi:hypothetical protein